MADFSIPINAFEVPKHVTLRLPPGNREDGMRAPITIPLSQLPVETLEALIEEFATAVMAVANEK